MEEVWSVVKHAGKLYRERFPVTGKWVLALVSFAVGYFLTCGLYILSAGNHVETRNIMTYLIGALTLSIIISAISLKILGTNIKRFWGSIILSYVCYVLFVIIISVHAGEFAEVVMWLPVIVIFGSFYMFPLTSLSWIGIFILFGSGKSKVK